MSDVTRILTAIKRGDARAADELLPIVYHELRRRDVVPSETLREMAPERGSGSSEASPGMAALFGAGSPGGPLPRET